MITDFNPLDLSAPPKKIEEQAPEPAPVFQAKPTVKRVSMGPIFHSRITKVLALILGIALAVLLGYSGMTYYLTKTNQTASSQSPNSTNTSQATTSSNNSTATTTEKTSTNQQSSSDSNTTSSANDTNTNTNTSTNPTAPCGVSGMPEGVCTAITSIEKDGLKNNKYVTADTSKVPAGSTVQVDEASWSATSGSTGAVNFSAVMSGKNYKGIGNLQLVDNIWKITSYTLN